MQSLISHLIHTYVIEEENIELLDSHLMRNHYFPQMTQVEINIYRRDLCRTCVAIGKLHLVEWCLRHGYDMDGFFYIAVEQTNELVCKKLLEYNVQVDAHAYYHLTLTCMTEDKLIELFRRHTLYVPDTKGSFSYVAAEFGHTKIMDVLIKEKDCVWDDHTFVIAAHNGKIDMVKKMIEENCPCLYEDVLHVAIDGGFLDIIKLVWNDWKSNLTLDNPLTEKFFLNKTRKLCIYAAEDAQFEIVKWFYSQQNLDIDNKIFSSFTNSKCICGIHWLIEHGYVVTDHDFIVAIKSCNLDVLDYLVVTRELRPKDGFCWIFNGYVINSFLVIKFALDNKIINMMHILVFTEKFKDNPYIICLLGLCHVFCESTDYTRKYSKDELFEIGHSIFTKYMNIIREHENEIVTEDVQ